ncbi:MAG: hypothetical protein ACOYLB_10495 [Phototrophicaceae bacterium]
MNTQPTSHPVLQLVASAWKTNRAMTLFFFLNVITFVIGIVGMLVDSRMVLGVSTWNKTAKFSISLAMYAATMLWTYHYIKGNARLKSIILNVAAFTLTAEILVILVQGARGTASHYNVATPFDTAMWSIMATAISIFYMVSLVGIFPLMTLNVQDRPFAWSLRLGTVLMLIGFGMGYLMTDPTTEQMAILQQGEFSAMIGGHTVGGLDGGEGLPFVGWSTQYGDLRLAHFVGIHGIQALALLGWLLMQMRHRFSEGTRLAWVWGAFLTYGGVLGIITWQAFRGQSVLQVDGLTGLAYGILLGGMLLYFSVVTLRTRPTLQPVG